MRADALPPEVERELAAVDDALAGRPVDPDLADLAALAVDLRSQRPEIDASFAGDLDRRAAAGFPREPGRLARLRPRLRPGGWMPALGLATTCLLIAVVSVTALRDGAERQTAGESASGGGSIGSPLPGADRLDSPDDDVAAPQPPAAESGGGGASIEPAPQDSAAMSVPPVPAPGSPGSDGRREREVERSASLTLATEPGRVDEVADGIVRVTDSLGGFVVTSSVTTTESGASGGSFELRVPTERLGQALAELSRLASVRERRQASRDITAEAVSARERLTEARAERRSLLRRLERAETDEAARAIRARLRAVSLRIRSARADLARVENRAAFSTIAVALQADPAAEEETGDGVWTPADAFDDALRVLEVVAGVALVATAVLIPVLLLGGAGLLGHRVARRRRRERALDAV